MTIVLGGGLHTLVLVISASLAPSYFRLVRSQTRTLKTAEYVTAAR
ncbi:MAG: hypothetical protein WDM92_00780 [Caulobacteraceae bacterium]